MKDTRFVREIQAQPAALREIAGFYSSDEGKIFLAKAAALLLSRRRIIFTGMGTSLHAPLLIIHELGEIAPFVEIRDAGELLHFGLEALRDDDAIVAVSQSGESAETRSVVSAAQRKAAVVSIVNNPASFMGKQADLTLPLHAGREASISAKTYTNTLAVLLLLSDALTGGDMDDSTDALRAVADSMETGMELSADAANSAAKFFGNIPSLHAVARGSDMVTARQLALIIKEGAGVAGEALSAGLFRHGPIELAGAGHSIVCILSRENRPDLTAALACELAGLGSRTLILSDSKEYSDFTGMTVTFDCPASRYFPLLCAPFIELFVHETARRKGREAGVFRHARKVTDRE
ncbi:MAG: SIS domain-containing protein [Candidatus Latescibacterota bacterium]